MSVTKRAAILGAGSAAILGASDGLARTTSTPQSGAALKYGEQVMALLDSTPYVQFGTGERVVYEVSFRECGPCITFARSGADALVQAGFQVRSFVYAPGPESRYEGATPGEMAAVAEIYRTRNADFFSAWYRSNNVDGFARGRNVQDVQPNSPAMQLIDTGRTKIRALIPLATSTIVPRRFGFPAFFWRKGNEVRSHFGYGTSTALITMLRRD